jgi:uncharacterized protein (DUF952 family)
MALFHKRHGETLSCKRSYWSKSMARVFKIVDEKAWADALTEGAFRGALIDLADGYIHLSADDQAVETAARHFAGQTGLLLVAFETEALGDKLIWEPSRGGALFPHLYEALPTRLALWAKPLPVGPDGQHIFPALDG